MPWAAKGSGAHVLAATHTFLGRLVMRTVPVVPGVLATGKAVQFPNGGNGKGPQREPTR